MNPEFRLKNIDETRNYFLEEINKNELMSRKHNKYCTTLNYIENFLILASTITGCIAISAFAYLFSIAIGIMSSAIGSKACAKAAGIKRYKRIIKKNKKKHDKIVLSTKTKLNCIEILICKALINSNFIHPEIRRNKKFKDLNSSLKILIYLQNNTIVLFSKRRINQKYIITG